MKKNSTHRLSYINILQDLFEFKAGILNDPATENLKRSCDIVMRMQLLFRIFFEPGFKNV